ncbi:hypothetical protein [Vibrio phage XZ1]|uniref:Uncharacterized protein n=2 Tax=Schizotequatrovirus valkk3 TaxID=1914021 RepID=A0A126HGT0_9CAUD|nr:hypothetical protein AVU32_gp274 [Vibrio phage ValKK3]ALP47063.1 hypothetical protein phiGrn1_0105 [Vibrio phage phi-Grn1]ALP47443.1 hypothetical protein phiST2_0236 [Vibrio phage phi-ST2]QBX06101.1 hypothetical protein Va3_147 [Vibrio phage Va3]QNJ54726.1 hypothetical protein vBValMR10Z_186 [Vibrio phage vB_ValM_R10Z]QNJ55113.1 hypothetical protein vBValMR11Z_187 [Vibrio phage vB_ValM_R11Z]UOL51162.1 hypothetical protein [Vibrio phage XZ1]URQ03571.1 hypothetical protein PVA23_194 [Vibrio
MKDLDIVRKALATNESPKRRNFRKAVIQLLEKRDLTVAEIVYSLNGGEYDERLRRRVQANVQNAPEIMVTRFETFGHTEIPVYTLKGDGKLEVLMPKRESPRKPVLGMESLLTRVLNLGLGRAVAVAGPQAVDAFKKLEPKQQARYISTLALSDHARSILTLVHSANLSKEQLKELNVKQLVRQNASYVVAKLHGSTAFFDNIKSVYG